MKAASGVILALLLLVAIMPSKDGGKPDGGGDPHIKVIFNEPSPELREKLRPVQELMHGDPAAVDLAFFYRHVAQLITPDEATGYTGAVTAEQARRLHREAGIALHRADPATTYHVQLQPLLEKLFADVVGLNNRRLTEEDQLAMVRLFDGVAWALWTSSDARSRVTYESPAEAFDIPADQQWTSGPPAYGVLPPEDEPAIDEQLPAPTERKADYGLLLPTPEELARFKAITPRFQALGLEGTGAGKTRLLYRSLLKFDPGAYSSEPQKTGDCTSHGTRNACDTSRAFELDVRGDLGSFQARGATECIYGYRGHGGEGMSVNRAVEFVSEHGGLAIRKKYGPFDLSEYNVGVGVRWGRQGGPPKEVLDEIRLHQSQNVVTCDTLEEARDAIFNGYALTVGCGSSFSSQRGPYGFAKETPNGWNHCMAWIATAPERVLVDGSESEEPCVLVANSWGVWNSGPKGRFKDIPDGSFWVRPDTARGMIRDASRYGQAVAVGNFDKFAPSPLDDWGFEYLAMAPASGYRCEIPTHWKGAAELAYGTSLSVVPRPDVTTPSDDELIGVVPNPSPAPDGVDDHCDLCKGKGVIVHGDGHSTRCSNPRCPYVKRLREVLIRRPGQEPRVELHPFAIGA